jgi:chromosome segregation ATPase
LRFIKKLLPFIQAIIEIKRKAITEVDKKINNQITDKDKQIELLKRLIILRFIKKLLPFIQAIIEIKRKAIIETKRKAITEVDKKTNINELLTQLIDEFEKYNEILNNPKSSEDAMSNATKNLSEINNQITNLINQITDKDKQIELLKGQIERYNRIIATYNKVIQELQKRFNIEILNQTNKGVEEKIIKEMIENHAKDIAKLVLHDRISQIRPTSTIHISKPATAPILPINDLKNTAMMGLHNNLMRIVREPIDVSKPPSNYDVLITDKTYKYENGKPIEIPEFTKYDSILA